MSKQMIDQMPRYLGFSFANANGDHGER
jgi:hypothetical protein